MSPRQLRPALLNLDILALSLLCCLLASVVALIVAQGHRPAGTKVPVVRIEPTAAPAPPAGPVVDWDRLSATANAFRREAESIGRRADAIATRVTRSAADRENLALTSRLTELGEKVALLQKIMAADSEASRLEKLLEERRREAAASGGREAQRLLGDYRGPYVLIECVEGAVTVYPGNERLDIKTAKAQLDRLVAQIVDAGFVAFVVRPGGWYEDSFDELRPRIYEALAKVKKDTGRYIGRNTLPLDASEPIADYLPNGGRT